MKAALVATVYNEAESLNGWLQSLAAQTEFPAEIIVVDGGSTDETPAQIAEFFSTNDFRTTGKLLHRKCNIAQGRNLGIAAASSDIIVCSDAGSILHPRWFEAMVEPFANGAQLVAGWTESQPKTDLQRRLRVYSEAWLKSTTPDNYLPSSRTIAFRRDVWRAVGGYPEWLTLTAEDALFNENLKAAGFKFYFQPKAIVYWDPQPTLGGFLRQMYAYGYGGGEAGLNTRDYLRWTLTTLCPPLIIFSKNPIRDIPLRFLRNAAAVLGWFSGKIAGKKPPAGWKRIENMLLSPETQEFLMRNQSENSSIHAEPR